MSTECKKYGIQYQLDHMITRMCSFYLNCIEVTHGAAIVGEGRHSMSMPGTEPHMLLCLSFCLLLRIPYRQGAWLHRLMRPSATEKRGMGRDE